MLEGMVPAVRRRHHAQALAQGDTTAPRAPRRTRGCHAQGESTVRALVLLTRLTVLRAPQDTIALLPPRHRRKIGATLRDADFSSSLPNRAPRHAPRDSTARGEARAQARSAVETNSIAPEAFLRGRMFQQVTTLPEGLPTAKSAPASPSASQDTTASTAFVMHALWARTPTRADCHPKRSAKSVMRAIFVRVQAQARSKRTARPLTLT